MKRFKRNAVILTVVLFVCVAAYLNWTYNKGGDTGGAGVPVEATASGAAVSAPPGPSDTGGDAGLYYNGDSSGAAAPAPSDDGSGAAGDTSGQTETQADFFASARLERQQARDASAATLTSVSQTNGASQQVIDAALAEISKIASTSEKETELESLIMAKGFSDCVAFISDDGVKITVPAPQEGLSTSSVAKITDIVTSETSFKAADLKIIEVK